MRLTTIDAQPFQSLRYWTSGPGGKPRLRELPFHRAQAEGLPEGIDSLVFLSDLQGREYLSLSLHGTERLLGEVVADELGRLVEKGDIPTVTGVLICGDLYDYPDCRKPGGTGEVSPVFEALSRVTNEVIGVLGNHDSLESIRSLPSNVQILDKQMVSMRSGLRIGGVSGIIGDPKRHNRRTEDDFLAAMETVTLRRPHILLLHQGPEDGPGNQRGVPAVTLSLETGFSGLTVFGHTHWPERFLIELGSGQAVNVDARVLIVSGSRS